MISELEKITLTEMAVAAGAKKDEVLEQIEERLNFKQNKKVIKQWLKDHGKAIDLRTELIKEKEMGSKVAEERRKTMEEQEEEKYKNIASRKEEITDYLKKNREIVVGEISEYNKHCESITYATLFACMNGNEGNQKTHVINKGKQGIGKSRGTTELVKNLNVDDAKIISGHITPKRLFETIKEYRHSMIVLDESEATLSNSQSLFILRSALYGGDVQWLSSKGEVLDSFKFTGTLIANLNHLGINEKESAPLYDRTLFNETDLENSQIVDKIKSTGDYEMKDEVWKNLKDRITLARHDGVEKLDDREKEKIMGFIEEVANTGSVYSKSLSTRAAARAKLVGCCVKTLFGSIEQNDNWELATKLMRPYIVSDSSEDLIAKLVREHPTMTRTDITELIADKKGISKRQASRYIKAAIENGIVVERNRTMLALPSSS